MIPKKCTNCGNTEDLVEVQMSHYTPKVTEPVCEYCLGSKIGNATMEAVHPAAFEAHTEKAKANDEVLNSLKIIREILASNLSEDSKLRLISAQVKESE